MLNNEQERMHRIQQRGALTTPDAFESQGTDFQQRVYAGYGALARDYQVPIIQCMSDDGVYKSPHKIQCEVLSIINS